MEQQMQLILTALADIQLGVDKYKRGQCDDGKRILNRSLHVLNQASQSPEWRAFFTDLNAYFATLEMADLGYVENIVSAETGFLKRYGLRGTDVVRLAQFYRQQRALTKPEAVFQLFSDPAKLVRSLKSQLDGILKGIDASRSLPRRLKKKARQVLTSPATHFVAGTMMILGNMFWLKNVQPSISVGIVFIGSAVKAKKSEKAGGAE